MDVGRVVYASDNTPFYRKKRVAGLLALVIVPCILVSDPSQLTYFGGLRPSSEHGNLLVLLFMQAQVSWDAHAVSGVTNAAGNSDNARSSYAKVEAGQTEKVTRKLIDNMPQNVDPHRSCKKGGKDLPKLVLVQEWRTKKQRPRESITLMTQLSADR